ncbi:hypothetical protein EL17_15765 [Anditalea andensis]|uniref:Uncharacterized protein n=1 Tax=Anditalea andensis TaxID=1048983 RepID=A0A074KVV0_9BACT|nr:hypothetical protein EL17_15765 [Anditalea andensis]
MKGAFSVYFHLILLTLILAGLTLILQLVGLENILHKHIWNMLLFFSLLAFIIGYLSQLILKKGKENFVYVILGGNIFRFIFSLGYILVFLFIGLDNIILFVTNFFIIYLLYLLFDIYGLMANLRPHSK